jgi:hypothetical protein
MKRSGPPRRKTPMARTGRLRPRNEKRARERREIAFGPQAELCRTLGCCVCGRVPAEPHHLKSRGAGGDDSWCIPLCRVCHYLFHLRGAVTFWKDYRMDPEVVLAQIRRMVTEATDNGR